MSRRPGTYWEGFAMGFSIAAFIATIALTIIRDIINANK